MPEYTGDPYRMIEMPERLIGERLREQLSVTPPYDEKIPELSVAKRLDLIGDVRRLYVPCSLAEEVYHKAYSAVRMSLKERSRNYASLVRNYSHPEIHGTGAGISFAVTGTAGIGKTAAVGRALDCVFGKRIIRVPGLDFIPCVYVTAASGMSSKALFTDIIRQISASAGAEYEKRQKRCSVDTLLSRALVLLKCVGILVVDEVQQLAEFQTGRKLVTELTKLINDAGCAICFVGTEEARDFLCSTPYLARRTEGPSLLSYSKEEYEQFCRELLRYRYVKRPFMNTELLEGWLYNNTGGNPGLTVDLFCLAQETALHTGSEELTIEGLIRAKKQALRGSQMHMNDLFFESNRCMEEELQRQAKEQRLLHAMHDAKRHGQDIAEAMKRVVPVMEARV